MPAGRKNRRNERRAAFPGCPPSCLSVMCLKRRRAALCSRPSSMDNDIRRARRPGAPPQSGETPALTEKFRKTAGGACPSRCPILAVIRPKKHRRRAGLLTRPPISGQVSFHAEDFAPRASFFPNDGKETKGSPGKTHIAVGNKFPPAPVRSPRTPVYGDTPIPSCNISGAQNMVPGMIPPGPLGPWCGAKFRPVPFYRRASFRPAVAEGARSGVRRTRPFPWSGDGRPQRAALRGNRENVLQQGTGGHRGSPALCGP